MACIITSPTVTDCNDLSGGVKKLELALWEKDFDESTATWVEILLAPNSADWEEVTSTDSKTKVTTYAQTLNFTSVGLGSLAGVGTFASLIVAAKITDYDDDVVMLGAQFGLSNNGSKAFLARELEGGQGYEFSFSGVQSIASIINP